MRRAEPTDMPVDIGAHARRGNSAGAWFVCAAVGIAGLAVFASSFGAMVGHPDAGSFWLPVVCVVGFFLFLSAAIYAWFGLEQLSRLRRADAE